MNKIIEIREQREKDAEEPKPKKKCLKISSNNDTVRSRVTPEINFHAISLKDLIKWDKDLHEPILTLKYTNEDLREFYSHPMNVPVFGLHTQSIERCVKQVIALVLKYLSIHLL